MKKIKADIKELKQKENSTRGLYTSRVLVANVKGAVEGRSQASGGLVFRYDLNHCTGIEGPMAKFRYYNPSAPSSLVIADFTTGDYSKVANVVRSHVKITMRANYHTDIHVSCWEYRVESDTDIVMPTGWTLALQDMSNETTATAGPTLNTNSLIFPTDCPLLTDIWIMKLVSKKLLKVGQERTFFLAGPDKPFEYDPALFDNHPLEYQKQYGARGLLFRLHGPISHDSVVANEVTYGRAAVDVIQENVYVYDYEAGAGITFVETTEGLDDQTTAPQEGLSIYPSDPTQEGYAL